MAAFAAAVAALLTAASVASRIAFLMAVASMISISSSDSVSLLAL